MKFSHLVEYFEHLEGTSSLNRMIGILARLLAESDTEEIGTVCYFTLGRIAPDYSDFSLGMGENLVRSSIELAAGVGEEKTGQMKEVGDLGDLAVRIGGSGERKFEEVFSFRDVLTVEDVRRGFAAIAGATGPGSQETKKRILAAMIAGASPAERRYFVRLATGQMRLGVGDMTLLDALARAYLGSQQERSHLEQAYNISSDIGYVAKVLKEKGISGVKGISILPNRPIRPMLAQRVGQMAEILQKIPDADIAAEEKFDGERIQAHKEGSKIRLFSRRLTDVTAQFPDVVQQVRNHVRATAVILDGEVVAFDLAKGVYYSFQELMHRRRKYRVAEYAQRLPLRYMLFDILWLDGESCLGMSYPERRRRLEEILGNGRFIALTERVVTRDLATIRAFFDSCIQRGLEGVVCKSCAGDSRYRAGSRDWQWIKWKTSYGTVRDTFDLVVVGAYAGRGRRGGMYGSVLCAALNAKTGLFQTVCRMGTGFSDTELAGLPARLRDASTAGPSPRVTIAKQIAPHYYFSPRYVLEVLAAEITKSPVHTCGWDEVKKRGFSLRFPRFVRWRPDRSAEETTTVQEITDLYRMQGGKRDETGDADSEQ